MLTVALIQLLDTDDEGTAFRRNFDDYLPVDTASHHIDCILRQHRCENLGSCRLLTVGIRLLVCSRCRVDRNLSGSFEDQH